MFTHLLAGACLVATLVAGGGVKVTVNVLSVDDKTAGVTKDFLPMIAAAGATEFIIGWFDAVTGNPMGNTIASLWTAEDAAWNRAAYGIEKLILGVQGSHWTRDATDVLSTSATWALSNGFNAIMWELAGLPPSSIADEDVSYVTNTVVAAAASSGPIDVMLSIPATFISPDVGSPTGKLSTTLFASLDNALTDRSRLIRIIVQYYNSGPDFSTESSIFRQATSSAAKLSAIAELESKAEHLKGLFTVGKPMKVADAGVGTTDFVPLDVLKSYVCNEKVTNEYDSDKGLTLFNYNTGDNETMIAAAFKTGACSGSAPTVAFSAVAMVGAVFAYLY